MDNQISDFGENLLQSLHNLINAVRIHQDNNQLIRECITRFRNVLDRMSHLEEISIDIWRGRFHLQGEKILYKRELFSLINEMLDYFSQRAFGGIVFYPESRETSDRDLLACIRLINDSVAMDDPAGWLEQQLLMKGNLWVRILREQDVVNLDPHQRLWEKARRTISHALVSVKDVAENASQGVVGARKTRRLAQDMVDLIQEDTSLMLGLATIRDHDDFTYIHSVNVAVLGAALGRRIGLSQVYLEYLTICGLFHDLGKVGVSKEILGKPGKLDSDEWAQMQMHPLLGVREILQLNAPRELKSKIILGPFEHHLNMDLSGYPKTHFMKHISLFGRILRIVDVYEALTSERVYRPRAFSPDEALRRMWCDIGKMFDPILLKSFVNMVGIYPVGTVLELDTGEIALVMDYPDEEEKSLPVIRLLENDGEGGMKGGELVNLAERKGRQSRKILRGLPYSHISIQPSEFFA